MFGLAAFLFPIIVTAGFQEPLDWEMGLDEGMYNLQSEPSFLFSFTTKLFGLLFLHTFFYKYTCFFFGTVTLTASKARAWKNLVRYV